MRRLQDKELREDSDLWNYDPNAALKSPNAYVGLKNQGATCYMNSFLQQLYHIPAVRDGLLDITDDQEDRAESVLFQLQVLFGYLRVSQKQYYDTKAFCYAFKDYDGTPVGARWRLWVPAVG